MKILNVMHPSPALHRAKQLFCYLWSIPTRTVMRQGDRGLAWEVYADLEGHGTRPNVLVAGGLATSRGRAAVQIMNRYHEWTITGPAGMRLGRRG